jgi:hypothetical protein
MSSSVVESTTYCALSETKANSTAKYVGTVNNPRYGIMSVATAIPVRHKPKVTGVNLISKLSFNSKTKYFDGFGMAIP